MGSHRIISESSNAGIGAIGSACILLAYVLITFATMVHRFTGWLPRSDSLTYQTLNLIGGAFAAASAYLTADVGALPLAVLESIWAVIAVAGIAQILCRGKAAQAQGQTQGAQAQEADEMEEGRTAGGGRSDAVVAEGGAKSSS